MAPTIDANGLPVVTKIEEIKIVGHDTSTFSGKPYTRFRTQLTTSRGKTEHLIRYSDFRGLYSRILKRLIRNMPEGVGKRGGSRRKPKVPTQADAAGARTARSNSLRGTNPRAAAAGAAATRAMPAIPGGGAVTVAPGTAPVPLRRSKTIGSRPASRRNSFNQFSMVDVDQAALDKQRTEKEKEAELSKKKVEAEQEEGRREAEAEKMKHKERIVKARQKSIRRRSRMSINLGELNSLDAAIAAGVAPEDGAAGLGSPTTPGNNYNEGSINEIKPLPSRGLQAPPAALSPTGSGKVFAAESSELEKFTVEACVHKIGGLGFSIKETPGKEFSLAISKVKDGGSAITAGLCPDDFLIAVDGNSMVGLTKPEGTVLLKETGDVVRIEVRRQKKALIRRRSSRRLPDSSSMRSLSRRRAGSEANLRRSNSLQNSIGTEAKLLVPEAADAAPAINPGAAPAAPAAQPRALSEADQEALDLAASLVADAEDSFFDAEEGPDANGNSADAAAADGDGADAGGLNTTIVEDEAAEQEAAGLPATVSKRSERFGAVWLAAGPINGKLSPQDVANSLNQSGLDEQVLRDVWAKAKRPGPPIDKMDRDEFELACELVVAAGGAFGGSGSGSTSASTPSAEDEAAAAAALAAANAAAAAPAPAPPPAATAAAGTTDEYDALSATLLAAAGVPPASSSSDEEKTSKETTAGNDGNDGNDGDDDTGNDGGPSRLSVARPSVQLDSAQLRKLLSRSNSKGKAQEDVLTEVDESPSSGGSASYVADKPGSAHEYCARHLAEVRELVRKNSADDFAGFKGEFKQASEVGLKHSTIAADRPANKIKNRFTNMKPFDHSRVKLAILNNAPESDYINANFVPGFNGNHEYIATQGPTPHDDFKSFWRMVWDCNTAAIVMVTAEIEGSRRKCHRYWPDPTSQPPQPTLKYGDIIVRHDATEVAGEHTVRSFTVQRGGETRTLSHFSFCGWPDRGMPSSTTPLLAMRTEVRKHLGSSSSSSSGAGPVVVHCTTGVSRTGTYIAIDRLACAIESRHRLLQVAPIVSNMRNARTQMVQTLAQYIFIYKALETSLEAEAVAALQARKASAAAAAAASRMLEETQDAITAASAAVAAQDRSLPELGAVSLAQWTCPEVVKWVQWLDMDQYADAIKREGVDGATLLVISEGLLASIRMSDEMDQMIFLTALHALEVNPQLALADGEKDSGFRGVTGRHRLLELKEAALMKQVRANSITRAERMAEPIQVFTGGVDATTVYKRIYVRKSDRVNDVVQTLLSRFSLPDPNPWRYELLEVTHRSGTFGTQQTQGSPTRRTERVLPENDKIADVVARFVRTPAALELRLRPYSIERDTIAVDTSVVAGQTVEKLVPIKPDITPMEVVASALAQMGLTEGIEKYSAEDAQTGEPLTGSLWVSGSGGTRLVTRTVRLTNAKAMIALDDEKISSLRAAISKSRKEKSELQDVVVQLKQMLLGMNDLQAEHVGLKDKYTELQGRMQSNRSDQQSELQNSNTALVAEKERARADRAERNLRIAALEDGLREAIRAKDAMAVFEQRVLVAEEAMREKDQVSLKHVKAEQTLRERMQKNYEAQAKKGSAGDAGVAALQASSTELAAVVDVLRADLDASVHTIYEKNLVQVELEATIASLKINGAGKSGSLASLDRGSKASLASASSSASGPPPDAAVVELIDAKKKLVEENFKEKTGRQELRQKVAELTAAVEEHERKANKTLAERLGPISELVSDRMVLQFTVKKVNNGIGMTLQSFDAKVEDDVRAGVYVKSLRMKGAADMAGLRRGDQIISVDGTTLVGATKVEGIERLKATAELVNVVVARNPVVGGAAVSGVAALRAIEASLQALSGEVAAGKKEIAGGEARYGVLKDKLEKLEAERTSLVKEMQGNAAAEEGIASDLALVVETLEARVADQSSEIQQLEEGSAAKDSVAEQLRVELAEAEEAAKVTAATMKSEVKADVVKAIASEAEKTKALQAEKELVEAALQESQQSLELSKEEYSLLVDATEAKQANLRGTEDEVKTLREEVAAARARADEQQEAYAELKTEAQGSIVSEEAKRAAADDRVREVEKQADAVHAKHQAELKQVKEVSEMEVTSAQTKATTAERVQASISEELAALKAKHEEMIAQREAEAGDVGEVREKLSAVSAELKAAIASKEEADAALEAAVDALKADADMKDELIETLQEELSLHKEDGAGKLYVLQQQVAQQQAEHQRSFTELTFQAQQRHQAVDAQNQQLRAMLTQAQAETERIENELSAKDLSSSALEIERDALKSNLAKQTAALAAASSSNFVDGMDAEEVAEELEKRKGEVEKLQMQVNAAKDFIKEREPDLGKDLDRHLRRGGSVRGGARSRRAGAAASSSNAAATASSSSADAGGGEGESAIAKEEEDGKSTTTATPTRERPSSSRRGGGGGAGGGINRDRGGSLARRRREKEQANETSLERRRREKAEAAAAAAEADN
eukprot:gene2579-6999_t